MDALFVVPTMVSPSVNIRVVPFLAKTIERNIILDNYATLKLALLKKYRHKSGFSESEDVNDLIDMVLNEGPRNQSGYVPQTAAGNIAGLAKDALTGNISKFVDAPFDAINKFTTSKDRQSDGKPTLGSTDSVEFPKGISFFNMISLEPTYLTIPVDMKRNFLGMGDMMERNLMLGVKCVPYQVQDVSNIVNLIKDMRGRSEIKKWFMKRWHSVVSSIPLTVPRQINRHGARGGISPSVFKDAPRKYDITKDIIFSPNSDTLSNPKALASRMSMRNTATWSTMTVFSVSDFDGLDLTETLMTYRDLVKAGWGDIIVVNSDRESAYFCTQKMSACYELGFSYMQNIMNLKGVLDSAEISRWTKPFHKVVTLRQAMKNVTRPTNETATAEEQIKKFLGE